MLTIGQTSYLRSNINSFIALAFVATYALCTGLIVWHFVVGDNPIAHIMGSEAAAQTTLQ